jgi:hypothetical protein
MRVKGVNPGAIRGPGKGLEDLPGTEAVELIGA